MNWKHTETVAHGPLRVQIEPTSRCNTRCRHCRHFYKDFGEDISEALFRKIAANALNDTRLAVLTGYGEPFIAHGFRAMTEECARRAIRTEVSTNGSALLDTDLVKELVRTDMHIVLSIDGARRETYEFMRPLMKWERITASLETLRREWLAAGTEARMSLSFAFCITKRNVLDIPELVRLAHRYGAREIRLQPLLEAEKRTELAGDALVDCPELVSPPFLEAISLARRHGITLGIPGGPLKRQILLGAERRRGPRGHAAYAARAAIMALDCLRTRGIASTIRNLASHVSPWTHNASAHPCTLPWTAAYFRVDGTVSPCCAMGQRLGDLNTQEWDEIWNGPRFRNVRRTIHGWNPTRDCRMCEDSCGINAGDRALYTRFFARLRAETIPIDSPALAFGHGFHDLEYVNGEPAQRWMAQQGELRVAIRSGARFLRLRIATLQPEHNMGFAHIDSAAPEPFDNTCDTIVFPLHRVTGKEIRLAISMDDSFHLPPDPRDLALLIRGVELLF